MSEVVDDAGAGPDGEALDGPAAERHVGPYRRHGRRYHDYSRQLGGGLYENVSHDERTSVGIEPLGDVLVTRAGRVERLERRPKVPLAALVTPVAMSFLAGAAVATLIAVRHHRRRR